MAAAVAIPGGEYVHTDMLARRVGWSMEKRTPGIGRCIGCGNERDLQGGLCMACDLELRAKEPPEELRDMRFVYEGRAPATPGQVILKQLLDKSPKDFLRAKKEAEAAYRSSLFGGKAPALPGETEPEVKDLGTEAVVALVDRWLAEQEGEVNP